MYPCEEDFGIVMAEAQACGTPVIGVHAGGALDIVREGTGWLVEPEVATCAPSIHRAADRGPRPRRDPGQRHALLLCPVPQRDGSDREGDVPTLGLALSGATALTMIAVAAVPALGATPPVGESPDVPGVVSGVKTVVPADAPISVRVTDGVGGVSLAASTNDPVEVLGYVGEPYLLLRGGAIYENRRSPSTYVNAVPPPQDIPSLDQLSGPPQWRKVGKGRTWHWHDHETHFGTTASARIKAHPDQGFRLENWTIDIRIAGRPVTVKGALDYSPAAAAIAPPPRNSASGGGSSRGLGYAALVGAQALVVLGILGGVMYRRRRRTT